MWNKKFFSLFFCALLLMSMTTLSANAESELDGCTGIVITGTYVDGPTEGDPWALLAKNSDTSNNVNEYPIHCPSKTFYLVWATGAETTTNQSVTSYAYTGCNSYTMSGAKAPFADRTLDTVVWGMNEKGMAVAYTQLDVAHTIMNVGVDYNTLGIGTRGRELASLILAFYDNVTEVLIDLTDPTSKIGSNNRRNEDAILMVDRFGQGAIAEVSILKAVYKTITNGYMVEDNVIRMWTLNDESSIESQATVIKPESESGIRTVHLKNITDELVTDYGAVNYRHAVQKMIRFTGHEEDGDDDFYINIQNYWDIVNDGTASSFVALTGDDRYEGALNCFWGTYGNPAILGVYEPHIPYAGAIPTNGSGTWTDSVTFDGTVYSTMRSFLDGAVRNYVGDYVEDPYNPYETVRYIWYYDLNRTNAVQTIAFTAENVTFSAYETMLSTISEELTDEQLETALADYMELWQQTATLSYQEGMLDSSLSINIVGEGTVSKNPNKDVYENGETVILTATPYKVVPGSNSVGDYAFYNWYYNSAFSETNPLSVVVTAGLTVTVNFAYVVNQVYGIYLYADFDGLDNIYGTPYFIHGPLLGDYPMFRIYGSSDLHEFGAGMTFENAIINDNFYLGANKAMELSGEGNTFTNITLTDCHRYGLTVTNAYNFIISNNTIEDAQYGISGSSGGGVSGWGRDGRIEYNTIRGCYNSGIKLKAFDGLYVQYNYIDITPTYKPNGGLISCIGIHFSNDAPNLNVIVRNNTIIKESAGTGASTFGIHSDIPASQETLEQQAKLADPEIDWYGDEIYYNSLTDLSYGLYLNYNYFLQYANTFSGILASRQVVGYLNTWTTTSTFIFSCTSTVTSTQTISSTTLTTVESTTTSCTTSETLSSTTLITLYTTLSSTISSTLSTTFCTVTSTSSFLITTISTTVSGATDVVYLTGEELPRFNDELKEIGEVLEVVVAISVIYLGLAVAQGNVPTGKNIIVLAVTFAIVVLMLTIIAYF